MMNTFSDFFATYGFLSKEVISDIDNISVNISFPANELILTAGSTSKDIYLIVNGAARLYYYSEGKEITNQFFFEGEIIADMESMYSKKRSNYNIQLLEHCDLIKIRYSALEKLYQQYHDLESIGRKLAIECFLEENERNRSYQIQTAKERYQSLIKKHPNILNRINLGHIASYIGITQVQLSRIRSELFSF
ncbi:Crp/Fnr family transcriptional regulator [Aquimarina algicola]|uniref:Crp/Fnr family transcriptional regulator n=1 Tax=Aquimarina algicola TaxID=2589995 RepID=A0A504J7D5_9FLAO|nr:Crp/Fnr family transcriptional regulator [Aquimarina algicola]TPN86766.1 Crp/Fnr family transcriptional regulator [Aquimarina algicola]